MVRISIGIVVLACILSIVYGVYGLLAENVSEPSLIHVVRPDISAIPVQSQVIDSVYDASGQVYSVIRLGRQIWLGENLRNSVSDCQGDQSMRWTDGLERGPNVQFYDGTPRYAYYKNQRDISWGAVYNFAAVRDCQLCPPGFTVPDKEDWQTLIDEFGGATLAGRHLRRDGDSGFNADFGGRVDSYGFVQVGNWGQYWADGTDTPHTPTKAYVLTIHLNGECSLDIEELRLGVSVRCIQKS